MKEIEIIPGKCYKGSAFLNKYGQWVFTPENKGSRPDAVKMIFQSLQNGYTLKETKNYFIVTVKAKKIGGIKSILERLSNSFISSIKKISEYDIK